MNKDNQSPLIEDVTYTQGYNFEFTVEGHHIKAFGSAKSGKEQVFVDGELVAQKRSFLRRSVIPFIVAGKKYEIEFYMANMRTAELHCSLIEDGTHLKTLKRAMKKHLQLPGQFFPFWLVIAVILGGITGFWLMQLLMNNLNA